ncbi:MAG: hypothetical protein QXV62_05955 [Nitrososphaerota archaeon]
MASWTFPGVNEEFCSRDLTPSNEQGAGENWPSSPDKALVCREDGGGKKALAYVDVGFRNAKRYMVLLKYEDEQEVRRVNSLLELLNFHVKDVYVDSLMCEGIPEVKALVERGVHIFYLPNPRLLRTVKGGNGMEKSDENDARVLSLIPSDNFRECSLDFLRLKELLMKHHKLRRQIQKIQHWNNVLPLNSYKAYVSAFQGRPKLAECIR